MNKNLIFRQLFDYETWTYTYLLADAATKEAILIDTVKEQVARDLQVLKELGLKLKYVLDTHIHADHITGASALKEATGALTAVSKRAGVPCVDIAIEEGQELAFGSFRVKAIATPGHTNTCTSFLCENMIFTGDTLFVRDVGRTDFQQGSNANMYESITKKLFSLPESTLVFPAHDYRGHSMSTIEEEKKYNSKLGGGISEKEFTERMLAMKLGQPKKIHIAVPANMACGKEL